MRASTGVAHSRAGCGTGSGAHVSSRSMGACLCAARAGFEVCSDEAIAGARTRRHSTGQGPARMRVDMVVSLEGWFRRAQPGTGTHFQPPPGRPGAIREMSGICKPSVTLSRVKIQLIGKYSSSAETRELWCAVRGFWLPAATRAVVKVRRSVRLRAMGALRTSGSLPRRFRLFP
jgi:hypothetical protein